MKIRTDFVTNSSSSNFTLEICFNLKNGKDIRFKDVGNYEGETVYYVKASPKELGCSKSIDMLIQLLTKRVFRSYLGMQKKKKFINQIKTIPSMDEIQSITISGEEENHNETYYRSYTYDLPAKEYTGTIKGDPFEEIDGDHSGDLCFDDLDCCDIIGPGVKRGDPITKEWDFTENCIYGYKGHDTIATVPSHIGDSEISVIKKRAFCPYGNVNKDVHDARKALIEIVLPNTIQYIEAEAFYGCENLTSVNIPEGVIAIGDYAFEGCESLKELRLPGSVKHIGYMAFHRCSQLQSIQVDPINSEYRSEGNCLIKGTTILQGCSTSRIPPDITIIEYKAFNYCSDLKEIVIPYGVKVIGSSAFEECSLLESIEIPGSVEHINVAAFSNCHNLRTVILSEGVKSINGYVFSRCEQLRSISLPASLINIGDHNFHESTHLESIHVDANNPVYRSECNCLIKEDTVIFGASDSVPETVSKIAAGAFVLTEERTITIPKNVTDINIEAFTGYNIIHNLIIRAEAGSYAAAFAKENYIRLEVIGQSTNAETDDILRYIVPRYMVCCLTGDFAFGSKESVTEYIYSLGGTCMPTVTTKTNMLIIGSLGSDGYAYGSFGGKFKKAKKMKDAGKNMTIIREEDFFKHFQRLDEDSGVEDEMLSFIEEQIQAEEAEKLAKKEKERLDSIAVIEQLKELYPDGITATISDLTKKHPEMPFSTLSRKSISYFGVPLKQYLEEQGILRPKIDPQAIVAQLKELYPEGTVTTISELIRRHPDLPIATLYSSSFSYFGVPLKKYLEEQGILIGIEEIDPKAIIAQLKELYPDGTETTVSELIRRHPDIPLAQLQKKSVVCFRVPLKKYLAEQGILIGIEEIDPKAIIAQLKELYPDGTETTVSELIRRHPDIPLAALNLRSMRNFGMPFKQYLIQEGILKTDKRSAEHNDSDLPVRPVGRPKGNPLATIEKLKALYPEGTTMTVGELQKLHPDLQIKSLQNQAPLLFGMPLSKYLIQEGVLIKEIKK